MTRRKLIALAAEAEASFRKTFRLKSLMADSPTAQMAFEHAAKYKLDPDEIQAIGQMVERIDDTSKLSEPSKPNGPYVSMESRVRPQTKSECDRLLNSLPNEARDIAKAIKVMIHSVDELRLRGCMTTEMHANFRKFVSEYL